LAVGGGVAMNNPTAVSITHVLNNKHEFPFCNGVSDLLVLSLGNGESDFNAVKSPSGFVKIAGEGASDMVRITKFINLPLLCVLKYNLKFHFIFS